MSAIITLTLLFTLIFYNLLALFCPASFAPPPLNFVSYSGAVVVWRARCAPPSATAGGPG
ncbi:hypothetical protein SGGMMB4_00922 [Sodalis glossinidius str. 'morsitans']|uniref:Uncharacterized protein n=1 Tax=Sodalis glossinidius (strain morsitans) TaxID=343509 RepID=A0A193QFT9_SODGM|nr:hypothetical protein SGGMMB4_00922 [Sodalis glossinidius str. 'morsitans']